MDTYVTKHAIQRYRERLFDFKSSDEVIKNILKKIACRGKRVDLRPATFGSCYEVIYKEVSIVLVIEDQSNAAIITCLGNAHYRKWVKHQDMLKIPGRILYLESYSFA